MDMHTEHVAPRGEPHTAELLRAAGLFLAPGTLIVGCLALVRKDGLLIVLGVLMAALLLGGAMWLLGRIGRLRAVPSRTPDARAPGTCPPSGHRPAHRSPTPATAT